MPAKVPLSVIMGNGNSAHLTKKEIEERMRTEIKAPSDNIKAPGYLSVGQKKKFNEVAEELKRIDIMTNLDIDTLARFVIADTLYIEITKLIQKEESQANMQQLEKMINIQDKFFKQCQATSRELGLTISSRVKLSAPMKAERKEVNKFDKFQKKGE